MKINLNEFEERFVAAHIPVEKTIRILCTSCHRQYDTIKGNRKIEVEIDSIPSETETNSENNENIETKLIEKLIKDTLNKANAIKIINEETNSKLNNANTLFSNINSAVDVWWLEPNNEKFKIGFNFILNSIEDRILYLFYLPAEAVTNPKTIFSQRNDSDYSKIYITKSTIVFKDKKGFNFEKYFVEKVKY